MRIVAAQGRICRHLLPREVQHLFACGELLSFESIAIRNELSLSLPECSIVDVILRLAPKVLDLTVEELAATLDREIRTVTESHAKSVLGERKRRKAFGK